MYPESGVRNTFARALAPPAHGGLELLFQGQQPLLVQLALGIGCQPDLQPLRRPAPPGIGHGAGFLFLAAASDVEGPLPPGHAQIHLGQQLRVEQRAVQRPVLVGDHQTLAQRIEVVALAGVALARHQQRIGDARDVRRKGTQVQPGQFGIQKARVERGVVDDDLGTAAEIQKLAGDLRKGGLVAQVVPGHAVHGGRPLVHLPLGVDVEVQVVAGDAPVDHLHAADLDDAVPLAGV